MEPTCFKLLPWDSHMIELIKTTCSSPRLQITADGITTQLC